MSETTTVRASLELAFGFTAEQLAANRRGELLSGQYPPLYWKLLGLCLLGLVIFLCVRWVLQNSGDPTGYLVVAAALATLVPVGFITAGVVDGLRDRIEARACSYTNVWNGVQGSSWGLSLYYVDIGPRLFWTRRWHLIQRMGAVKAQTAYTVYYACHSGSLASLEPAAPDWKMPEGAEHLEELGELFEFDAADLETNRIGKVNFGQIPLGKVAGGLVFIGGFALFGLACVLEFLKKPSLPVLGLGLVLWLIVGGISYGNRGLFLDLATQRSCSLAGTLTALNFRYGKTSTYWQLTIDGKTIEFIHPNQGTSLLRIGSPYRAHYLCHSQHLVSIEPLS